MDIIENIISYLKIPEDANKGDTPEGLCPVCWGYQQYDGKLRKLFEDKQIDVNNHQDKYMLVQDFTVKHLDGIKLKGGAVKACPNCGGIKDENNER